MDQLSEQRDFPASKTLQEHAQWYGVCNKEQLGIGLPMRYRPAVRSLFHCFRKPKSDRKQQRWGVVKPLDDSTLKQRSVKANGAIKRVLFGEVAESERR